ncbi:HET-domain-containing protein, partial [Bimuria novae-zelandiae CBS 107.79]
MSDEHISLAKTWGHGCFAEHPECPKYEPNWMPTRLIEILDKNNIRLVDTESLAAPVPYYALSYCWGEEPVLTTTGAVIQDFKSQILLEDLPLTIEDAITVVRRMGGHFLWVDSLCIIQDDLDDWAREAATMCDVYQNSYLTIVALGAHGATDGLFARRDPLAVTDCCLPSISANRVVPVRETVNNNYDTDFFRSNLEHRGWTFQERALAPRKLFFSSFIFWECATSFTVGKEEFPDAHEWRESTVDPYHRRPLPGEVVCVPIRLDAFGLYKVPEWLGQWYTDLFDFSGRDLTKATDRLTAIAGVISHRERASGRKTDYGVWLDFWPFDLLWSCLYGERAERLDGAPTWSWASLTAQV